MHCAHCRSYLLAYNSHALKDTFNVHSLDLAAVARSFGFTSPPRVSDALAAAVGLGHGQNTQAGMLQWLRSVCSAASDV